VPVNKLTQRGIGLLGGLFLVAFVAYHLFIFGSVIAGLFGVHL
jgi:hypothetical protein